MVITVACHATDAGSIPVARSKRTKGANMNQYSLMRRDIPWRPRFYWNDDLGEVADAINKPHEDYPKRVMDTYSVLLGLNMKNYKFPMDITHDLILSIHRQIFKDVPFKGQYRDVNVRVGNHVAPHYEQVQQLMDELINESQYIVDTGGIYKFYHDFETIHPFQDGNGRVGGVLVAIMSNAINPASGYMTPIQ